MILECGELELESRAGCRLRLQTGATFWLAGLPLRCLHNPGPQPAVLAAITRRTGDPD